MSGSTMPEPDWYAESLSDIQSSIAHLQDMLVRTSDVLVRARAQRLAGISLVDLVVGQLAAGGQDARRASFRAFHEFEHAVSVYRAGVIRALVDDENLTFTQLGDLFGVSRQMIARLYGTTRDAGSESVQDKPDA